LILKAVWTPKQKNALQQRQKEKIGTDKQLYLDIETDVYYSGTIHDEHQPAFCRILDAEKCFQCRETYFMPCTRFCPAKVYEEKIDCSGNFTGIQVSFSNCLYSKTCEIKDPLRNVAWHMPKGGDGPRYKNM
jgi:electron-transferring-flavoprotein dehydrogenase